MSYLYLSKNVVKKMKRSEDIMLLIENFVKKSELLIKNNDIEYINDKIYDFKLIFDAKIVFDISEQEDLIIWDVHKEKLNFKRGYREYYPLQNAENIIDGNQFIKINLENGNIKNLLKNIRESNSIEVNYCLDFLQKKILNDFEYNYSNYQVISGAAGSGKTLMLHRLAYKCIETGKKYIYIAFTSTLKDRFKNFINNILDEKQNLNDNVYTYEEFLRDYIAPKLNINSNDYITFNECSVIVKKIIKKYKLIEAKFTISDLTRIVMSMGTDLGNDGKKENDISKNLNNRLSDMINASELIVSEKEKTS